jgi:uncharacterized protein GlcG (DUF336 family)
VISYVIQQVVIRGDAAPVHTLSVAYRKAYTAFFSGRNFKNTIGDLIAGKLTGPENGALNTAPEVLFVPAGLALRTTDNTVVGGLGVSGAPGGDKDEACAIDAPLSFKTSCSDGLRSRNFSWLNALTERGKNGAPDHGLGPKTFAHH